MLQLNIVLCIAIFQGVNYIMQRFEQCIYFYVKKLCVSNNVYKDNLHLLLIEENLVLAPRTVEPFSKDGNLHPALVSLNIGSYYVQLVHTFKIIIYSLNLLYIAILLFLQTFKPLVDNVGLWKNKHNKPVEFLGDLRLDFQDCNKLKTIKVLC